MTRSDPNPRPVTSGWSAAPPTSGGRRGSDHYTRDQVDELLAQQRQQLESSIWLEQMQDALNKVTNGLSDLGQRMTVEINAVRNEIASARGEFKVATETVMGLRDDFERRLASVRIDMDERDRHYQERDREYKVLRHQISPFALDQLSPAEMAVLVPLLRLVCQKLPIIETMIRKEEAGTYVQQAQQHAERKTELRIGRVAQLAGIAVATFTALGVVAGGVDYAFHFFASRH